MYFSRLLTFKDFGLEMHENRVHQKCLVKCSKPDKIKSKMKKKSHIPQASAHEGEKTSIDNKSVHEEKKEDLSNLED